MLAGMSIRGLGTLSRALMGASDSMVRPQPRLRNAPKNADENLFTKFGATLRHVPTNPDVFSVPPPCIFSVIGHPRKEDGRPGKGKSVVRRGRKAYGSLEAETAGLPKGGPTALIFPFTHRSKPSKLL